MKAGARVAGATPDAVRARMVQAQLAARGIADPRVLEAFAAIPREAFLPAELAEFAYQDSPLPIAGGQTISQPYIVAVTLEALRLRPGERVLEVGTGSGYAAALLGRLAAEVFTVERLEELADEARERLRRLGFANVRVLCGDGSLGWPEHAPYDAIAVAAGGPAIPRALLAQLAPGGRLVLPVGPDAESQMLVRVTRVDRDRFREEPIAPVRFVPLVGAQGWPETESVFRNPARPARGLPGLVREAAEPLDSLDSDAIARLARRAADARIVLLGESTHGTSEFYRTRDRITRALVERHGFRFVAVEADWPDAARVDRYVRGDGAPDGVRFTPFARFPTWMWRNNEIHDFIEWLRARNHDHTRREGRAGFHGLDLYSLFTSMAIVIDYLDKVDPQAAQAARIRYGALTPWQKDPAAYGQAVLAGRYAGAEQAVVATLRDMLERRLDYARRDGERFFDAAQNARVVADAECYYRAMYYGGAASWNLRDAHMFETLRALLAWYGPDARAVVWAHNSHVGDARATEMGARGELNIGELCREHFGDGAFAIGFGTDRGTVAAASGWDAPMERMSVRPALPGSYERLCHDAGVPAFLLPLREPRRREVREELMPARLERAIGVVYRPDTERLSHYFQAALPRQFDEWIWFDETRAIEPLPTGPPEGRDLPETYPFGL